jgi:plasmid replication initiation protein
MSRCWFSLTPGRVEPIQHLYENARSGETESIRITGTPEYGIATVYDQDLLIYVISQWVEARRAGLQPSRRVHFTPYQFLSWMDREPGGGQYQRLKEMLNRLRTTTIETTVRSCNRRKNRVRQFSWISEWEITEENGEIRGVEVVLAEWLFESVEDFHVLTLGKEYFDIQGTLERWLYLYARKATGGKDGVWRETFKSLYQKSASLSEFKHFANSLRKLTKKNELPGLRLAQRLSTKGKPMLIMERTEKRSTVEIKDTEAQPELIERTPVEEAWERVLDLLRKQLGESTVNSWLVSLHLIGWENGTLTYRAKTKFIAEWVQSHYSGRLRAAWKTAGYEVKTLVVESSRNKAAA